MARGKLLEFRWEVEASMNMLDKLSYAGQSVG